MKIDTNFFQETISYPTFFSDRQKTKVEYFSDKQSTTFNIVFPIEMHFFGWQYLRQYLSHSADFLPFCVFLCFFRNEEQIEKF